MKFCPKCGNPTDDHATFCNQCGAPLNDQPNTDGTAHSSSDFQGTGGTQNNYYQQNKYYQSTGGTPFRSSYGITPRSIPLCIILSIVTCGIYGIYWMLKLNDEINLLCGDTNATSGALVVIFSLITCGIYGFYWMYKMGEKCDFIKGVQGSSGILYLLLGIFGLSIVDFCLIQDTINKSV